MKAPLNTPSQSGERVLAGEFNWPRDFDFREAYAEQRELLDQAPLCRETPNHVRGTERND